MQQSCVCETYREHGRPRDCAVLATTTGGGTIMAAPLEVRKLTVSYYDNKVLDDVSFTVERAGLIGIVGPNGGGKSTLIKALLGLIPHDRGEISFFGQNLRHVRRRIAYMPQRTQIDWDFPITVLETVLIGTYPTVGWIRRPGKAERDRAWACLEKVGMESCARRQIGELSGGQQQRVFIARALAQDPAMLLLDEPFAGIDRKSEETILSILEEFRDAGKTALIVHHDLRKVRDHFDEALLLNKSAVAYGRVEDVLSPERISTLYSVPLLRPLEVVV